MNASKLKLHRALVSEGFNVTQDRFLEAYDLAHEKYRKVRYGQLHEVTNAVWVSEALCNLGFESTADDASVKAALNIFFQDFLDTLELRVDAKKLLRQVQSQCKVALMSNFTYAPVIYMSLRKLGINDFFSVVVVSEEVGWRKPSNLIFQVALNRLQVQANEAIYVGDSPIEDIKGAKMAGLRTLFVPSQFNKLKDLQDSKQEPDFVAKDLTMVLKQLKSAFN